jgi:hypothetical protein
MHIERVTNPVIIKKYNLSHGDWNELKFTHIYITLSYLWNSLYNNKNNLIMSSSYVYMALNLQLWFFL